MPTLMSTITLQEDIFFRPHLRCFLDNLIADLQISFRSKKLIHNSLSNSLEFLKKLFLIQNSQEKYEMIWPHLLFKEHERTDVNNLEEP